MEKQWKSVDFCEKAMKINRFQWNSNENQWIFMKTNDKQWISIEKLWNSLDFNQEAFQIYEFQWKPTK